MDDLIDAQQFRERLAETIAWCSWRLEVSMAERGTWTWRSDWHADAPEVLLPDDLEGCLRSDELRPSYLFNYNAEEHLLPRDAHRLKAVDGVALRRSDLLRRQNRVVGVADGDLAGGRMLAYEPDHSLWDGPSGGETDGYIEVTYDVPPWDSWVCFVPRLSCLVSYVPPSLVALVNDGVAVCSSGCLFWLDAPNARRYKQRDHLEAFAQLDFLTRR